MKQIISKEECSQHPARFMTDLRKNVIIHPTDTIYGLGCDATNPSLVAKIRELKQSRLQPFSVIAPSKQWIVENCIVTAEQESEWLSKLPGPYTLIFPLKNANAIAPNVTQGLPSLGVRLPDHWFQEVVSRLNTPFVTTSANITAGEFMTNIDNLQTDIKNSVDYIVYEGEKKGRPSIIVHLDKEDVYVRER